jgi:hypothetical protein
MPPNPGTHAHALPPAGILRRLLGGVPADFNAGLNVWRRENSSVRLEFNLANVSDYRYAIAKESEETPIQYASPRLVAGRITFTF